MFEIVQQSNPKVLVTHFSGKITGDEYQKFVDAVEERLKAGNEVDLVVDLTGVEFYGDFSAVKKDVKFTTGDYKKIRKTAMVGDQKWINWYTKTLGHLTPTEEKHFPAGQAQQAIDWASA